MFILHLYFIFFFVIFFNILMVMLYIVFCYCVIKFWTSIEHINIESILFNFFFYSRVIDQCNQRRKKNKKIESKYHIYSILCQFEYSLEKNNSFPGGMFHVFRLISHDSFLLKCYIYVMINHKKRNNIHLLN